MRSNHPSFPLPPGGPMVELRLMLLFRPTLCAIRALPETPHPGLRYVKGPDLG